MGRGARILLIVLGSLMLLPGICTLIFIPTVILEGDAFSQWGGLWLIFFAISALGILLIRAARRNR